MTHLFYLNFVPAPKQALNEIMPGYLKYTATVHNLFGFVISLLLVFRTNTTYDRWWEEH